MPIVKEGDRWRFDTEAGSEEVIARRIGRNEMSAIDTSRAYVAAQLRYAEQGHDGKPAGLYAMALSSDPGKENGLYWPAKRRQKTESARRPGRAGRPGWHDAPRPDVAHAVSWLLLQDPEGARPRRAGRGQELRGERRHVRRVCAGRLAGGVRRDRRDDVHRRPRRRGSPAGSGAEDRLGSAGDHRFQPRRGVGGGRSRRSRRRNGRAPGSPTLLDDGNPVGRPSAVEAERHADRQADCGDRFTSEVLRVEDDHVAENRGRGRRHTTGSSRRPRSRRRAFARTPAPRSCGLGRSRAPRSSAAACHASSPVRRPRHRPPLIRGNSSPRSSITVSVSRPDGRCSVHRTRIGAPSLGPF